MLRRILPEAHSYKTFANAQAVAEKAIEDYIELGGAEQRYVIVAQENGRFSPAIVLCSSTDMGYFLHHTKCSIMAS